ncbi:MAG: DUF4012 domain-containing protein [Actinomycetota bacterium]
MANDGPDAATESTEDAPGSVEVEDDVAVADAEPGPWFDAATALPIVVGATAILAVFSGQTPTENPIADLVLAAAFSGGVAWLASIVRAQDRRFLGVAALLALFFSGFQMPALAFALAAVVVAFVLADMVPRAPASIVHAAVGGLVVLAVLGLPNIRFVGSASVLAVVALAPIAFAAWQAMDASQRSSTIRIAAGVIGFAVVATVIAVVMALWARSTVERGIDLAEQGIDALEAGDQTGAVELLEASQRDFETAHSRLSNLAVWPSRVVPITAQHSRALESAASQGRNLAAAAAKTVTTADVEQIRGSNGAIDLGIVRSVAAELGNSNRVLRNAQAELRSVRSPWLLPLLDDRLASVEVELADVVADIDLANHATAVVPSILGGDGPRTYLVLFVQPAEAREYGGFVGAFGLLRADQGRLSLIESGSTDLLDGSDAEFADAAAFPEAYFQKLPFRFPQNVTAIGDLSTIAAATRELLPQWKDDPGLTIDGVMTVDPYAMAGFLELTGPVDVPVSDEPIDSSNVAEFLLRTQYLEFDEDERDLRQEGLNELAAAVFGSLLSIDIPGPERLGAIFGPLARSDRLAFTTFNEDENLFLRRILLDADMPIVSDEIDMIGWYQATGVAGKIDAYSTRDLSWDVVVDPSTGAANGRLTVDLRNDAPISAGEYVLGNIDRPGIDGESTLEVGTNFVVGSLITRAEVSRFESPEAETSAGDPTPMLTYQHRAIAIEVPTGEPQRIEADLSSTVAPGRYDVLIASQAMATVGRFSVTVTAAPGWRIIDDGIGGNGQVDDDGVWRHSGPLEHHEPISVVFEPTDS